MDYRRSRADAGAVSGIVNVAHQIGALLGLGIVTAYAATTNASLAEVNLIAERTHLAMIASSVMMAAALLIILLVLMRKPAIALPERPIVAGPIAL